MNSQTPDGEHQAGSLVSWPKIAHYLGVSVRTAQIWEQQHQLPVHRTPTSFKSVVEAFPEELDSWMHTAMVTRHGGQAKTERWPPFPLAAVLLVATVITAGGWLLHVGSVAEGTAFCDVKGQTLRGFTAAGKLLWQREFPQLDNGVYDAGYESHVFVPFRLLDLDGDGRNEVFFNSIEINGSHRSHAVVGLSHDGQIRWRRPLGRLTLRDSQDPSPPPLEAFMDGMTVLGETGLLVLVSDDETRSSQIFLLAGESGTVIRHYPHQGRIKDYSIRDSNGDGLQDIVLVGDNSEGERMLSVIDLYVEAEVRYPLGVAAHDRAIEWALQTNLVFPQPDVCGEGATAAPFVRIVAGEHPNRLMLLSYEGGCGGGLIYTLEFPGLEIVDVRASDHFVATHKSLWHQGQLDHDLTADEIASYAQVQRYETIPYGSEELPN